MTAANNLIPVCKTSDVADGEAIRVEVLNLVLAIFNIAGCFYVTDDQCTHGPGLLSEGYIDGDVVECNFHNGAFHIPTGKPVASPCIIPLRTFPVTIVDDQVCIDSANARQGQAPSSTSA